MASTEKPKRVSPRKGIKGPSSTGKVVNVEADQSNWRTKLMTSRIKFDDPQKQIYLNALATHGMKGRSAEAAGVSAQLVRDHLENDPEFQEGYASALETYRDRVVEHATNLALDGIEVIKYNKDGDIVERRMDYPIRLIELELKRVDPAFREKQTIDVNQSGGGVLVAPAEMTPEEWINGQQEANKDKVKPGSKD